MGWVALWIAIAAVTIFEKHCEHQEKMYKLKNNIVDEKPDFSDLDDSI